MAAVLWLLLNVMYAPSCGRFACGYVPSWLPQASADSGDACPDSITAAASDAAWAADRIEELLRLPGRVSFPAPAKPSSVSFCRSATH